MSGSLAHPPRILVLGASGMLGNTLLRDLIEAGFDAWGTIRSGSSAARFPDLVRTRLSCGVDAGNIDSLMRAFDEVRPDAVINCVGLIKQLAEAGDPLSAIPINAILPHRLAKLCSVLGARLIHISTDCVFNGEAGGYVESDVPNATDVYGRSKLLGEVDYPNAITLRTSIIGHELNSAHGLVNWFLAQQGSVPGFTGAVFSGLPTVELSRVIREFVIPRPDLSGLYHVSTSPISKFHLLRLIADVYGKAVDVIPDGHLVIDRSLDSTHFRSATGYRPPAWRELIEAMRDFSLPRI